MKALRVLSLFDGMACGYEALKRAGIPVAEYHAFEIDKYAMKVAIKNHPDIIYHGEITFMTDFRQFDGFDLVMGGSPCQGFSIAGNGAAFYDKRSQLFFEFCRALLEVKPKYFLLENVKMRKQHQEVIDNMLGVAPIEINSALLSAQNRKRLYWCNWPVKQPHDKGILLKDIIEEGFVDKDKSYCIDANYWKGGNLEQYFDKSRRQLVFGAAQRGRNIVDGKRKDFLGAPTEQRIEIGSEKSNCLTSVQKDSLLAILQRPRGNNIGGIKAQDGKTPCLSSNSWEDNNHLTDGFTIRKLTPVECERLQTLPDGYTEGVSNSQRYRMLGNGWTVDVIAHIFSYMNGGF
jgi:DNA-cytosine methyltransferase